MSARRGDRKPHIERALHREGRGWVCFGPGWEGVARDDTPRAAYLRWRHCVAQSKLAPWRTGARDP